MKIILIGFGIFTGGVLLGAIGIMEEEKNIFSYVGIFISLVGFFVGFLAVIEDQMRGH